MAFTLHVDIVSAEKQIFSGQAGMVVAPAVNGELGILPFHAPPRARLKPGLVRLVAGGDTKESVFVSGGFVEVQPHLVTILADTALRTRDVDEAAARAVADAGHLPARND